MLADFHFSPRERACLARLARIVCPPELDGYGICDDVVEEFELMVRALPPVFRRGLQAGLLAFDQGARLLPGSRGRAFRDLDEPATAERYLDSWAKSPLRPQREFAKAAKQLLGFCYYEQPRVLERLGVNPVPYIAEVSRRRLEVYGQAVQEAEAEVTR